MEGNAANGFSENRRHSGTRRSPSTVMGILRERDCGFVGGGRSEIRNRCVNDERNNVKVGVDEEIVESLL